eukprot:CAMPEP_0197024696 /NCGR_PEP_ID=MMETSP1384-20130603/5197_1 /TAXON_ID=29189 /ORGANISM="Ammonia sp." /LENGTH=473 /DNA_ID=CAMNT_0042453121 /DNA_START=118 /DNA_END=1539 /DNA_ORIENTATION=+
MPKQRKNKAKKKKKQPSTSSKQWKKAKHPHADNSRIQEVKDVKHLKIESDAREAEEIADIDITTSSPVSSSHDTLHSPLKLHSYDADASDSDSAPLHHDGYSPIYGASSSPYRSQLQILRSAKISHRDSTPSTPSEYGHSHFLPPLGLSRAQSNPPCISPAFDRNSSPLLSSHHYTSTPLLSPTPILRTASSPLLSRSPLRARREHATPPSVSFGAVEIHEFKLVAGTESDGVPEEGGLSLHLDATEVNAETLHVDEYEKKRYNRWKQRAQRLHWNQSKLSRAISEPERYLWTAGRNDEFFSSLTPREREQRLSINQEWKRSHSKELSAERQQLDRLRASRKKNEIFCNCKPLSSMSTAELKVVAKQYGIEVEPKRKVKRGFLINRLKSQVSNYRDVCCWDKISCSCFAAGIDCHSGTEQRHFQCGCVAFHTKCANQNGRYVYKEPSYSQKLISEWKRYYEGDAVGFEGSHKI